MCNEEYFLKSFAEIAIQMIENSDIELQREAIELNYNHIKHIKNPSEEIQLLAVSKNVSAFQYIKKPCQNAQIKICEKNGKYINEQIKDELELKIEQQDILGGVRFFFEFINTKENFILELQIEVRKSTIIENANETATPVEECCVGSAG